MKQRLKVTLNFTVDVTESPKADSHNKALFAAILADEALLDTCVRCEVADWLKDIVNWHHFLKTKEWEDIMAPATLPLPIADRRYFSNSNKEGWQYESLEGVIQSFKVTMESVEVREA